MKINYASMSNNYMLINHIYRISYGYTIKINLLCVKQYLNFVKNLKVMNFVKPMWRQKT